MRLPPAAQKPKMKFTKRTHRTPSIPFPTIDYSQKKRTGNEPERTAPNPALALHTKRSEYRSVAQSDATTH